MTYPRWSELTDEERKAVNNGCGPEWMPVRIKQFLFGWMFYAQCGHHDFGYLVGGGEMRRLYCDLRFAQEMWKDVLKQYRDTRFIDAAFALVVGLMFAVIVMGFGWLQYNYGKPLTIRGAMMRQSTGKSKLSARLKRFRF